MISKDLYALDLGTTKFCIAALKASTKGGPPTAEIIGVPAAGMRRGMVADFSQAKQAITTLLEVAERQLGCDIRRVVVGIAGSHLQSKTISSAKSLMMGTVHENDLRDLVEQVETDFQLEARELLHCVPIHYKVDMREPVESPVGFSGRVLHGEFFLIDADKSYLKDVVRLCNQCGLEVARLIAEPFASASVTVPDERKNLGVVLADIGGGTTDGLIFLHGRPRNGFTINVGGSLMTNDVAIGLNLPLDEAERVKTFFGLQSRHGSEVIEVRDLKNKPRTVSWQNIYPILAPRIQELTTMIARQIVSYKGTLGGGLMLTGGGSEVSGIAEYMEERLGMPVEKIRPMIRLGAVASSQSPSKSPGQASTPLTFATKYATVLGLLNLEICHANERRRDRKVQWSSRYIGQFINWLRDLS